MSENPDAAQPASPAKRARDADREQIITLLDSALADGQLDGFDHRERVATALRATTLADLGATVADLQVTPPTFLLPPTPAPAPAPAPAPTRQPDRAPTVALGTPSAPAKADETGRDSGTLATLLLCGAAAAIVLVMVAIFAQAADGVGGRDTRGTGPFGSGVLVKKCDGNGQHCTNANGDPVPDVPHDKPPIPGVSVVGNPMASSNIRLVYESMITALAPTTVRMLSVTPSTTEAIVNRTDDTTQSQRWTLSDGQWHFDTLWDQRTVPTGVTGTFTVDAMNLDKITRAIADAPGTARTVREPTSVTFTATRVTIDYPASGADHATLILAPDGTVVA